MSQRSGSATPALAGRLVSTSVVTGDPPPVHVWSTAITPVPGRGAAGVPFGRAAEKAGS